MTPDVFLEDSLSFCPLGYIFLVFDYVGVFVWWDRASNSESNIRSADQLDATHGSSLGITLAAECWTGSTPYHPFNSPRRVMSELGPAPSRWHLELSNGNKSQLILEIDFCFFNTNKCCRKQPGWYRSRVLLANKRWWNQRINEDDGTIRATGTWCCWVTLEPLWRLIAPMEPCCWCQEWF